jgi:hypothetical protein
VDWGFKLLTTKLEIFFSIVMMFVGRTLL